MNLCVNSCNLACVCHSFLSHVGCTGASFALLAGGLVRLRSAADVFAVTCCRLDSLSAAVASSCVDRKAAKCHHHESLPSQPASAKKISDVHTFVGFSFFAYFSVCSRARRSKSGRLFLYSADWWRDERNRGRGRLSHKRTVAWTQELKQGPGAKAVQDSRDAQRRAAGRRPDWARP